MIERKKERKKGKKREKKRDEEDMICVYVIFPWIIDRGRISCANRGRIPTRCVGSHTVHGCFRPEMHGSRYPSVHGGGTLHEGRGLGVEYRGGGLRDTLAVGGE